MKEAVLKDVLRCPQFVITPETLTRAVERRRMASSVLAEVKVMSLLFLASFRISTYAPVM
jgi:hypothetical protein